jgi:P27 family predicted phage terminase small subunit
VWRRVADSLPPGLLASCDADLFGCYVTAVTMHEEAARELTKTGLVIKGANGGAILSPLIRAQNRSALLMARLGSELGLSPTSRTHLASRLATAGSAAEFIMAGRPQPKSRLDIYLEQKPDRLAGDDGEPN